LLLSRGLSPADYDRFQIDNPLRAYQFRQRGQK